MTAALPHHSDLNTQRLSLVRDERVLADLAPQDVFGLAQRKDADKPGIAQEIKQHEPCFLQDWRVLGKPGLPVRPAALLVLIDKVTHEYEAQPLLYCWPYVLPTLRGHGRLIDFPRVTVKPKDFLYLRATWTITTHGIGCEAPELFFSSDPELEAQNDIATKPLNPDDDRRTWTFTVGSVDDQGVFTTTDLGNPPVIFVPPPFRR